MTRKSFSFFSFYITTYDTDDKSGYRKLKLVNKNQQLVLVQVHSTPG